MFKKELIMKFLSILAVLVFLTFSTSYSENSFRINSDLVKLDKQSLEILNKSNPNSISKFEVYKDRLLAIPEYSKNGILLRDFPVSASELSDIYLVQAPSIVDEFTVFARLTDDGLVNFSGFNITSFTGQIKNDENSKVYLNFIDDEISALVIRSSGEIFEILKFPDSKDSKFIAWHTIEQKDWTDILSKVNQFCGTEDIPGIYHEIPQKYLEDEIQATELIAIPIAVEGEYYFFEQMGKDNQRAIKYMLSVMSQTSRIYEEFINVTFIFLICK